MFDWNLFPHVDFNKVNLDWIADCLKALMGGTTNQILSKKSDEDFDFEWVDNTGGGSGGTTDYNELSNLPSINNVLLKNNKSFSQLGLTPAAIGAYVKPSTGIPASDLAYDVLPNVDDKAPVIVETASGAIAHFVDGADSMPVKALAIDGVESATVTRTGKNLFSYENIKRKGIYRATVSQMGEDLNSFYLSGAPGADDMPQLLVNPWSYVDVFTGFRVEETAITVSCKVKNYTENCNGFVRVRYNTTENRDGSTVVNTVYFNAVGTSNISISGIIPSGNYVIFEFSPAAKAEDITLTQYAEVTDFQFELCSTATAYEPYRSDTFAYPSETVTTLYGVNNIWSDAGTVDVTYRADTKLYIDKKIASIASI